MMMPISKILESNSNVMVEDEDGNELVIKLFEGVSLELLNGIEESNGFHFPDDIREFLLYSNGAELFGVKVFSLEKMNIFHDEKLICFHEWGNGDFDLISVKHNRYFGKIFFSSHSIDNLYPICSSFNYWVLTVINEIKEKRTLLHPMDYLERNESGLYKKVLLK